MPEIENKPASTGITNVNPAPQPKKPVSVKIVLLGEAGSGKSSIVLRFVNNEFYENREPTIGAAFLTQKLDIGHAIVKFEIWDTAGQERFHSLAPMYYRNAQAAVVVYDITRESSFEKAKSWIMELRRQANANITIALAGNKSDMHESRAISEEVAQNYAKENNLIYWETSAKTGDAIYAMFTDIGSKLPQSVLENANRAQNLNRPSSENINLNNRPNFNSPNGQCAC